MPIMPTWISFWKRRAAPPSLVKIAVPLPNCAGVDQFDALVVGCRPARSQSTGPKISSV